MQRLPMTVLRRRFTTEGADFSVSIQRAYGDLVYSDMPLIGRIYYIFHPDHIHEILLTPVGEVDKPLFIRGILRSSFGNGLFTSGGEVWKRQRRLMQPTFHHAKIGHFAERITSHAEKHQQAWRDGDELSIDAEMHALTFKIIIDALFSSDASDDTAQVGQAMHDLGQGIAAQGNNFALALLPDWVPLPSLRQKQRGVTAINQVISQMTTSRRTLGEDASPVDLLSALIFTRDASSGEMMSNQQVRDELMTLFIAGHETTAVLLGWVWVLLAQNPVIEAKLHAELDSVLQGRTPTLADLPNLPYTLQIIKETLRLYPPAWFLFRQNFQPITLGNTIIPQNSILFIFPYATHRDPRWFADADAFQPERWAGDFEKTLPKGAYFPFGMGARVCIGNGFAMMEAQLLLASLAQRWQLELRSEARPFKGTTTLGFESSVLMEIFRREGSS